MGAKSILSLLWLICDSQRNVLIVKIFQNRSTPDILACLLDLVCYTSQHNLAIVSKTKVNNLTFFFFLHYSAFNFLSCCLLCNLIFQLEFLSKFGSILYAKLSLPQEYMHRFNKVHILQHQQLPFFGTDVLCADLFQSQNCIVLCHIY